MKSVADIDRSASAAPEAASAAPEAESADVPEAAAAAPADVPAAAVLAHVPADVHADVASFFDGVPLGIEVFRALGRELAALGWFEVRVTRSQVAFRRRRGFAWLWRPGRWLRNPAADVVLSFALREPIESARLKQVTQASPRTWMHHLEVRDAADLDDTVLGWLRQAFEEAE